jgi:hypothetical protein
MKENIFKPTIQETQFKATKSYNINNLFYVSFFGGILATIIISTRNAKWLKISKQTINLLISIGIALLFLKILLSSAVFNNLFISHTSENLRYLRWGFRILALLLYYAYFQVMKQSYRKHIMLGGQDEPLLKYAIILIIIASIIEFILLLIGKVIIDYVI